MERYIWNGNLLRLIKNGPMESVISDLIDAKNENKGRLKHEGKNNSEPD